MAGTEGRKAVCVCCFCGHSLPEMVAVRMLVYPPNAEGESQTLFCHARHLVQHLDPRVPHHPALDEDGDG